MIWSRCEPSLEDMLSDPIVQAVMRADGVDRRALDDLLSEIARERRAAGKESNCSTRISAG
jgi:hypothetical protein